MLSQPIEKTVFGCVARYAGHLLLHTQQGYYSRRRGSRPYLPVLYLQSRNRQELLDALVEIRGKIAKDLWVTEAHHGAEYSLVAAPFYLPVVGWHLPSVYSFVVTPAGIDTKVLKKQFTECLELTKFGNPPCTGCRFSTKECLQQYHMPEALPNSAPSENVQLRETPKAGYRTTSAWARMYECVPGIERLDAAIMPFDIIGDIEPLEASVRAMLAMSARVQVIDDKHSYAHPDGIFEPTPRRPTDIDLSEATVASNKLQLRERSLASAASRRMVREQCSKCLIAKKCDQMVPRTCSGAITELDQIRETLRKAVREFFGKVPLITDTWVQATLKLSGEFLKYRDLRRKTGRPAGVTPVLVLPRGSKFHQGPYYGADNHRCTEETLVLQYRGKHIHVPFNDGDFTNYGENRVRSLLGGPDVVLSEDTLLMAMYLMTVQWIYGSWGAKKCLNYVSVQETSVQVGYTGRSKYSGSSWIVRDLPDMHLPSLTHDLRQSVKR